LNNNYRGLEIIVGDNCNCVLSKHAGKRMLYSEVLELLKNSNSACSCTFKHFKDRRHKFDKRKFDADSLTSDADRRTMPYGRRVVDIHNRSLDRFADVRMETTLTALHQTE
jgi:hypothetical protein